MEIRRLEKPDFDRVVSLLDQWWGGPSIERAHPVFFYELGRDAIVAVKDGELVGFLLGFLAQTYPPTAYVHLVGIHPDHRRRRVGQRLYEHFIEQCRAQGAERVKAVATVGNEGSERFHRALGFRVETDADYAGPGRARMVFFKDLATP